MCWHIDFHRPHKSATAQRVSTVPFFSFLFQEMQLICPVYRAKSMLTPYYIWDMKYMRYMRYRSIVNTKCHTVVYSTRGSIVQLTLKHWNLSFHNFLRTKSMRSENYTSTWTVWRIEQTVGPSWPHLHSCQIKYGIYSMTAYYFANDLVTSVPGCISKKQDDRLEKKLCVWCVVYTLSSC